MRGFPSIGALALMGVLLAGPVPAAEQSSPDTASPPADQSAATPAPADQPAASPTQTGSVAEPAPPAAPATVAAPPQSVTITGPASADLAVAAVKPKGGWRASKLIGAAVYNDQNQKIGSIDDLMVTPDGKLTIAVISVGGFLGMGSKLVAVPYDQLRFETNKDNGERVLLPGGSKESLNAMPNFTYGNT